MKHLLVSICNKGLFNETFNHKYITKDYEMKL